MRVFVTLVFLLVFACGSFAEAVAQSGLAAGKAASSAAPVRLSAVDSIIQQAIADHNIPGAVLVVGHDGKIIYRKAYGARALEPRRELMTVDTIFDMASLTKVVATTTAVMQLV
jgi:CubicO group peptidase (beta-lactamase class C family)